MNDDNVISIASKKPIETGNIALEGDGRPRKPNYMSNGLRESTLVMIDEIRKRVVAGDIDGLCVVARGPENGAFIKVVALDFENLRPDVAYAYAGAMDDMKSSIGELTAAGPHMSFDGQIFMQEVDEYDDI